MRALLFSDAFLIMLCLSAIVITVGVVVAVLICYRLSRKCDIGTLTTSDKENKL